MSWTGLGTQWILVVLIIPAIKVVSEKGLPSTGDDSITGIFMEKDLSPIFASYGMAYNLFISYLFQ